MERVRTEGAAVLFSFSAAGQPWRSTMASQGLSQSRGSPADGWVSQPLGGLSSSLPHPPLGTSTLEQCPAQRGLTPGTQERSPPGAWSVSNFTESLSLSLRVSQLWEARS